MNSKEIEHNINQIFENFSKEEFIFDLLMAYGISKTSITRLRKGDYNLSKIEGEILYKKKVFFKEESNDKLLSSIDTFSKEERILKHNPRFVILTDYETLVAKDIKLGKNLDIPIQELPKYFDFFLPLAGSEVYNTKNDNKADREAAYKMAELYDELRTANPGIYNSKERIHELNIFLSRLLFCFFAEDTGIFDEDSIFTNTLAQHTTDNGSDTSIFLNDLFKRLNTTNGDLFPAYLSKFPYVNGGLFRDVIESPQFNFKARKILIGLGELQWQEINPDIFGSMIQAVVEPEYRSDLGMHYTSVENILKLIRPLFLDELEEEFEKHKDNDQQLKRLIFRMSKIKFFDPACGSGNFLIITYKEIRSLEIRILQRMIELDSNPQIVFTQIQLSQFYGIEIDDFAHEMAILSLWLAEHQMNNYFEEQLLDYGKSKPILPLKEAGKITRSNAIRVDWQTVCPITEDDEAYIIGNPPYLGYSKQDDEQKKDMSIAFSGIRNYKKLDYIACWFYKATQYIEATNCKYSFVSTNSITQGEQVALLWPLILNKNQEIFFAYQSFKWANNAKGNAGVSVVIIGMRNNINKTKYLYQDNHKRATFNISPYLVEGKNIIISKRTKPLSNFPEMQKGSQPTDGGNLLLDASEKSEMINKYPLLEKNIKPYFGAQEYINGDERFCLWIENEDLEEVLKIDEINKRLEAVVVMRTNSTKNATNILASVPYKFGEIRFYNKEAIILPTITSERRQYIPCGFVDGNTIISNTAQAIYDFQPFVFGVVTSRMMVIWVKAVGGKFKTDYIFSSSICYNTFPFPNIGAKQKENLSLYVFSILDERAKYSEKTLAQLYDPNTMPLGLKRAHKELDAAIERCYRLQPFTSDTERLEYLFKLYEDMLQKDTLFAKQKKSRTKKNKE